MPTEGGREALEAVLGCPVAAFELVDTSAAQGAETPAWRDAPPPDPTPPEAQPVPEPLPEPLAPTWWGAEADARHAAAVAVLVAAGMAVPPPDDWEDDRNNFACIMPDPDDALPEVVLLTPWQRVARRQARDDAGLSP